MLEVTISESTKARIRVSPTTAAGLPASLDGTVTVDAASGDAVNPVAVVESADTFTVQADLPPDVLAADFDFNVGGDADLGAGVEPLADVVRVHVTKDKAVNLGLTQVEVVPR